ncbi:hypothetical protein BDB01DRAFT_137018 [Pilobolus umbonatus]|nr:hypothetical protein BDB01DRAFT_137018 [Pilobolus umbonatus]
MHSSRPLFITVINYPLIQCRVIVLFSIYNNSAALFHNSHQTITTIHTQYSTVISFIYLHMLGARALVVGSRAT